MQITSDAFKNKELIPPEYTCDGENVSPSLFWQDVPSGTKTLVLIVDDPDAPKGIWVHWIVYNIPANVSHFDKDLKNYDDFRRTVKFGITDFKTTGYGGPCPPSGVHRYFFKLYALDCELNLSSGKTKREITSKMEGHILAHCELIGLYEKQ